MSPRKTLFPLGMMLLCTAVALAQSSGSFSYGNGTQAGGGLGGTTACVMDNHGTITGGQSCVVSSVGSCPEASPLVACAPGSTGNAACVTAEGSGALCLPDATSPNGGYCSTTACQLFTCTGNSDCQSIYGSNSGATCSQGVCTLPASSGTCIGNAVAGLKTNSGNGNVFDIRPSAVIGLLTDVTISSKQSSTLSTSSALAGIDFTVTVIPKSGQMKPSLTPNETITYDGRFVQISTNLFQGLTSNCTTQAGGCFITFAESTVSAHSFDWIAGSTFTGSGVPLSSGEYEIQASWAPSVGFGLAAGSIGEAAACVGPVNLTVSQNKIFQFNTVNDF